MAEFYSLKNNNLFFFKLNLKQYIFKTFYRVRTVYGRSFSGLNDDVDDKWGVKVKLVINFVNITFKMLSSIEMQIFHGALRMLNVIDNFLRKLPKKKKNFEILTLACKIVHFTIIVCI